MANIHSQAEKEQMRHNIMNAAANLFQSSDYLNITMQEVAKQANISKGSVFNYFSTKEDLFMMVLLEGYQDYFRQLIQKIANEQITNQNLIAFLKNETRILILKHAQLLRLNALRGPILESKANMQETIHQRNLLYQLQDKLGETLYKKVKLLSADEFSHFFIIQSGIISGIMNMNALNQFDHQKLEMDYRNFKIEIVEEAMRQVKYYLHGRIQEVNNE